MNDLLRGILWFGLALMVGAAALWLNPPYRECAHDRTDPMAVRCVR